MHICVARNKITSLPYCFNSYWYVFVTMIIHLGNMAFGAYAMWCIEKSRNINYAF